MFADSPTAPRRSRHKGPRSFLTAVLAALLFVALFGLAAFALTGCGASEETTGASFEAQSSISTASFHESKAEGANGAYVDTSATDKGYVAAKANASSKLKLQVTSGQQSNNYDLPNNGRAIVCPLTFGDGNYTFRVMQNTSGNNYVEIYRTSADVELDSEFEPFLRPNVYCDYDENSACVAKARELVANAETQADALKAICSYVVENISYDNTKAEKLKKATGYVPDPDETLESGSGICFDYASLGAAMLRSQGIPTKITTGYVSPDNIYHAWIMVYIDGSWTGAQFDIESKTWSRVDLTFAASAGTNNVSDGKDYQDRFTY